MYSNFILEILYIFGYLRTHYVISIQLYIICKNKLETHYLPSGFL
jgi:hypothetical protein